MNPFHTHVALMRGAVSTEIEAVLCFRVSKTLANSPDFSSPQSEFQQTLHSSPYKYYWVLETSSVQIQGYALDVETACVCSAEGEMRESP